MEFPGDLKKIDLSGKYDFAQIKASLGIFAEERCSWRRRILAFRSSGGVSRRKSSAVEAHQVGGSKKQKKGFEQIGRKVGIA